MNVVQAEVIPSGYVVMRSFDIVRQDPKHLVTALRIIEREEQFDLYLLDQQKKTGFLPPGRPKFWRKKSLEKLRYLCLDNEHLKLSTFLQGKRFPEGGGESVGK